MFENIKGRPQNYTSVDAAIRHRVGDCEERAGVFIALCRAAGIPARLVWVPSHCWAEILLVDTRKKMHWIPVHTAAYSWFGWTGVHEVVLQKGDNIRIPQQRKKVRLVYDHFQCKGRKPKLEFTMSIKPVANSGKDAGPGAREKMPNGRWKLVRKHDADKFPPQRLRLPARHRTCSTRNMYKVREYASAVSTLACRDFASKVPGRFAFVVCDSR